MRANRLKSFSFAIIAVSGCVIGSAQAATSPTGVWIDHTGRGGVEIKECGNGKLCGHVVWLKDQGDAKGCGLQILGNVKPVGRGQWDNGWIYSPEKKQKFSVELTPIDDNRLRVKGYKGMKLFSKTMIWHRASSSLERCDQTTTARVTPPEKPAPKIETAAPAKTKPAPVVEPRIINPSADVRDAPSKPSDQQTARAPAVSASPSGDRGDDIYAEPPRDDDRGARSDRYGRDNGDGAEDINGLASLLENFAKDDGVEVGDGYGMKVEKGPNGEKNCRLDVPFVTVKFPCED